MCQQIRFKIDDSFIKRISQTEPANRELGIISPLARYCHRHPRPRASLPARSARSARRYKTSESGRRPSRLALHSLPATAASIARAALSVPARAPISNSSESARCSFSTHNRVVSEHDHAVARLGARVGGGSLLSAGSTRAR